VRLLLRAVEDVDESSWIKVNIVDKNLTWKEAQEAFTKHFEIYSYSAQLVKDYEHIKQYTKQSVQEYSHKFNRLCIELGYDESNPLVIQHYLNGLIPERHASYKKQMAIVKLTTGNVSMFTSSLEEAIKLTSELEIADLNSQVQHNYHTDNKSQSLNNTYSTQVKKKVCANHPNSSTHTTAECSLTKTGSKSHTTNNTSATNSTNNNTTKPQNNYNNSEGAKKKPVKCHVCGGPHYANDPICPKHSDRATRATSTSATSTNNVTIPSTASTSPEGKASIQQGRSATIDRTLPTEVIIPEHKNVMFLVENKVYNTLCDTGATFCSIDASLCEELKLNITPPTGSRRIGLANDTSAERVGTVHLDDITVLFPSTERNVCTLNHRFEVMKLKDQHKDYHFVIGADLLPLLFPDGIPLCYIPPASNTNGKPMVVSRAVHLLDELTSDIGYEELPLSEQPNRPVASTPK
jgi:hypothetical protein